VIRRVYDNFRLILASALREWAFLDHRFYMLLSLPGMQESLENIGRLRAKMVFRRAQRTCPAYQQFLSEQDFREPTPWTMTAIPETDKPNYVLKYSLEQRCYDGEIPLVGTVIDESSGSSGNPNNWVRNAWDRQDSGRLIKLHYRLINPEPRILLNCFALGPWATGMAVSMSMVQVGALKSIGPDAAKLEATLRQFGPKYQYMIFGYPPFMKSFVDNTTLDLSAYTLDLVVGGEGMSEGFREYLEQHFQSIISSYGASDLEINIGLETELSIAIRKACSKNPGLSEALFGKPTPPMLFQYNPLDYLVEQNAQGELLFTVCRLASAAPKIRYNLKDLGGVLPLKRMNEILLEHGMKPESLLEGPTARFSHFPFLYIFGRNDLSVAFFGAKVFPHNFEEIIRGDSELVKHLHSFQIGVQEDEKQNRTLEVALELMPAASESNLPKNLQTVLFDALCRVNQDFREVTKMFPREALRITVFSHEQGPFAARNKNIKHKYVA
jgi:phenylacetate-CoA ligase